MGFFLWLWQVLTGSKFKALRIEGRRLLKAGRHVEALEIFREMVRLWPENPEGYEGMAQAYTAMGLTLEARRDSAIASALRRLAEQPDDLKARIELVEGLLAKEMYEQAVVHVEHALELAPKDERVLRLAAQAYRKTRQYRKAVEVLRRALKENPLDPELYELLAQALRLVGMQAEALKMGSLGEALKALAEDPTDPEAIAHAVRQLMGVGFANLAVELVERCIEQGANSPEVFLLKGKLLFEQHDHEGAEEALTRALELDPVLQEAHELLAQVYQITGHWDKARTHRQLAETIARAKDHADPLEGQVILVKVLLEMGKLEEAMRRAQDLETKAPEDWRSLFAMGLVYRRKGELERARTYLERAKSKNAMNAELRIELAKLYSQMGEALEAVSEGRRAVNLDPRNPAIRLALAEILRRHGYTDQAVEEEELAEALTRSAQTRDVF